MKKNKKEYSILFCRISFFFLLFFPLDFSERSCKEGKERKRGKSKRYHSPIESNQKHLLVIDELLSFGTIQRERERGRRQIEIPNGSGFSEALRFLLRQLRDAGTHTHSLSFPFFFFFFSLRFVLDDRTCWAMDGLELNFLIYFFWLCLGLLLLLGSFFFFFCLVDFMGLLGLARITGFYGFCQWFLGKSAFIANLKYHLTIL